MTSFSKKSANGGIVPTIDVAFQFLCFALSGVASGVALSLAMRGDAGGFAMVLDGLPRALAPDIERLVAASAATPDWIFHGKIFLLQWISLYLPFALSLALFHAGLPGLHRNARRLGALVFASAYVVTCLGALKATNAAWGNAGVLSFIPSGSPTFFQLVRATLFTTAVLGLCIPFIFKGGRDGSRALRVLMAIALFVGWVVWDWRSTREARSLDEAALSERARHRVVLVVPDLTRDALLEALSMPEAQTLKERLVSIAPVFPVSSYELPQLATLVTGKLPPEHGVRDDSSTPEALSRVASLARQTMTALSDSPSAEQGRPEQGAPSVGPMHRVRYTAAVGALHSDAELWEKIGDAGRWCAADVARRARVGVLENSPLASALIPARVFDDAFPDSRCSQRFGTLEQLVSKELDDVGTLLKSPREVDAWFVLRPHQVNGWQGIEEDPLDKPPSALALRELQTHRLASVFQTVADQITNWGLWHNTDVWVVGLGYAPTEFDSTSGAGVRFGALALHTARPQSTGRPESNAGLVAQVDIVQTIGGISNAASPQDLPRYYNETPLSIEADSSSDQGAGGPVVLDADGRPRVRLDWQRTAIARSTRRTLCRLERVRAGANASVDSSREIDAVLVAIENGHGPNSSHVSTRILVGVDVANPPQSDEAACASWGRDALVRSWRADLDLPVMSWDLLVSLKPSADETYGIPTGQTSPPTSNTARGVTP